MTYTKTGPSYWTKLVNDPHDLLARHKMSELLAYDPATTRRDQLLWDFHLGWQVEKYGHTSLASVRTIHDVLTDRSPTGKSPLSLRHIAEGNRALCDRGLLKEIEKGTGRRGSRYALNWDLLSQAAIGQPFSVSAEGCASGPNDSVSPEETGVFPTGGKLNGVSVPLCGNEDPTPYPVERPGYGVGGTNVPAGGGAMHHHPDGGLTPPPGGKPPGGG